MCYGKWGTWNISAAYTVVPSYLMFMRNAGNLAQYVPTYLMFMRHKESLPDKFHHIWCLWDTQNLSNLYVPSYLIRHTELLNPVISILVDVYETQNVSTPTVPSYLMLHGACSSASLHLLVSLYEEGVKVHLISGSQQTGNWEQCRRSWSYPLLEYTLLCSPIL